jgi:FkbM family methyltransferase
MIPKALKQIMSILGDKNYQYGRGRPYFLLESLGSKASRDRRLFEAIDFEGKTIYDVGAYIGVLTTFFAKKVGTKGKVVAFEPNPENFSKLLVNVAAYPNVTTFNLGLGHRCEKLTMMASAYSRATGTVEPSVKREIARGPHAEWSVQIVPLDTLNSLPPPHFVKIDVEGYEYNVLEGMKNTIVSHRPMICIEINGVTYAIKRGNVLRLLNFLGDFDYRLFHIETRRRISLSYIPLTGHVLAYFQDKREVSSPQLYYWRHARS